MSISALRDNNRVVTWFGVSSVDGVTPVQIKATATGFLVEDGVTVMPVITNGVPIDAFRDNNRATCIMGQSNTDSTVYIPVSVNPLTGAIQIQTT